MTNFKRNRKVFDVQNKLDWTHQYMLSVFNSDRETSLVYNPFTEDLLVSVDCQSHNYSVYKVSIEDFNRLRDCLLERKSKQDTPVKKGKGKEPEIEEIQVAEEIFIKGDTLIFNNDNANCERNIKMVEDVWLSFLEHLLFQSYQLHLMRKSKLYVKLNPEYPYAGKLNALPKTEGNLVTLLRAKNGRCYVAWNETMKPIESAAFIFEIEEMDKNDEKVSFDFKTYTSGDNGFIHFISELDSFDRDYDENK